MAIKVGAMADLLFAEGLDGNTGRPAKALPQVAWELAQAWQLPYSETLRRLADELANDADVQLFVSDGVGFVKPLADNRVLRSGEQPTKISLEGFRRFKASRNEITSGGIDARIRSREWQLFGSMPAGSFGYQPAHRSQDIKPELRGRLGVVVLLQEASGWARSPDSFKPRGTLANLSMLASDVARLAGESASHVLRLVPRGKQDSVSEGHDQGQRSETDSGKSDAKSLKGKARIAAALMQLAELKGRVGAVKTVADGIGVSERTIRKWVAASAPLKQSQAAIGGMVAALAPKR